MLEIFEDLWEKKPEEARKRLGREGDVVVETGDAEIDEIERRLAAGEDPEELFKDWGEGLGDKEEVDDDYDETDEPEPAGLSWANKE